MGITGGGDTEGKRRGSLNTEVPGWDQNLPPESIPEVVRAVEHHGRP